MKKMMSIILAFLGVPELGKVDGKPSLTEEQKALVEGAFGTEFTAKFAEYLNAGDSDTAASDVGVELVLGLNAQNQRQLEDLKRQLDTVNRDKATLQATVAKLSESPEPEPAVVALNPALPHKEGVKTIKGIDASKPLYKEVNMFITTGRASDLRAVAATIDVEDLKTEFGTYLSQNNNNLDEVKALFQGFTSAKYFTSAMAITEWRATQALISSVSQQFKAKWTPSGQSTFRPLTIKNYRHKINMPIIPADVLESYMLHMYDEGMSVDQMPITRYIWQQLVLPQLLQDIELRMIFKGKYVDAGVVVEGAAGTAPEDSMDGIETILVDGLDGTKNINYFDGSGFNFETATDAEVLGFVQDFTSWLAPVFRQQTMPIACSYEFWRRYKIAYKNVWGTGSGTTDPNFGGDRIDFSNNVLVPMDGMYGSPILFTTPSANLKKLRHINDVPNVINDVQRFNYEARLFGEYWLGGGFAYGEAVFAYVPAGYNPKALITSVYGAHTTIQQNKGANPDFTLTPGSGGGGV
jgi:hypothetical protein